jgi:ADP-heptose:LPS heptosyltransferase
MSLRGRTYIRRMRAIGDVVWIEPIIEEFARKKKEVIVITDFPILFDNYPYPNVVFKTAFKKKKKWLLFVLRLFKKDVYINLNRSYEKRPKQHILHAYQEVAGLPIKRCYPKLYLSEAEKKLFAHLPKYVVIHIETFRKNFRDIYGVDWQIIINYLKDKGFITVVIAQEKPDLQNIYYYSTSLREVLALIYNAAFFIGLDSGPSHFAAALKIPSIIFFGSVNPSFRHFLEQAKIIIMQQDCEFAGCYHDAKRTEGGGSCKLVGNEGIPKCSLHSNFALISKIDELIATHNITA